MKYRSKFHEHVHCTLTGPQYDELIKQFGAGNGKKFLRLMSYPGEATNAELMIFSEALKMDTVTLMDEYGVGNTTLTKPEKNMHVHYRFLRQKVEDLSGALAV